MKRPRSADPRGDETTLAKDMNGKHDVAGEGRAGSIVQADAPINSLDAINQALRQADLAAPGSTKKERKSGKGSLVQSPFSRPAPMSPREAQQLWLERAMDEVPEYELEETGTPYVFGADAGPAGLKLHWESDDYCTIRVEAILPGGQADAKVTADSLDVDAYLNAGC